MIIQEMRLDERVAGTALWNSEPFGATTTTGRSRTGWSSVSSWSAAGSSWSGHWLICRSAETSRRGRDEEPVRADLLPLI